MSSPLSDSAHPLSVYPLDATVCIDCGFESSTVARSIHSRITPTPPSVRIGVSSSSTPLHPPMPLTPIPALHIPHLRYSARHHRPFVIPLERCHSVPPALFPFVRMQSTLPSRDYSLAPWSYTLDPPPRIYHVYVGQRLYPPTANRQLSRTPIVACVSCLSMLIRRRQTVSNRALVLRRALPLSY